VLWASLIVENIGRLVTMDGSGPHGLGEIEDAVVVVDGARIAWVGPKAALPAPVKGVPVVDAKGGCVLPGLIDCHTHLVFAGDRSDEFARRARNETYQQIMAAGGGIRSTMRKVRAASVDELVEETRPRRDALLARGVTTVEVKSGYGLDVASELKMLQAAKVLRDDDVIDVVPTLLAAHAIPPEHEGDASAWIDVIVRELLPEVARERLATSCDIFVENNAFHVGHGRELLSRAKDLGLAVRVHAEQLSHQGGALLAAELGALSAGHLEHVDERDIEALAKAGVVCEVLSLAQVFLRGQRAIPGRALVDGGCVVAVATDCNPGTAMSTDLPLAAGLSVTQSGLTAEEALRGMTVNAAKALALDDRGVIAAGKRADLLVLSTSAWTDLVYRWGDSFTRAVVSRGRVMFRA
jgi:imidazolonepropionase